MRNRIGYFYFIIINKLPLFIKVKFKEILTIRHQDTPDRSCHNDNPTYL